MALTAPRRIIIAAYLALVIALCLYVPWGRPVSYGRCLPAGYAPIWSSGEDEYGRPRRVVDTSRLIIELVVATAAAGLVLLLTASTVTIQRAPTRAVPQGAGTRIPPDRPTLGSAGATKRVAVETEEDRPTKPGVPVETRAPETTATRLREPKDPPAIAADEGIGDAEPAGGHSNALPTWLVWLHCGEILASPLLFSVPGLLSDIVYSLHALFAPKAPRVLSDRYLALMLTFLGAGGSMWFATNLVPADDLGTFRAWQVGGAVAFYMGLRRRDGTKGTAWSPDSVTSAGGVDEDTETDDF